MRPAPGLLSGPGANAELLRNGAHVRGHGEGLIILDVSDPPNPVRLGNCRSPRGPGRMAKVGDLLYVTEEWNGITILDVSDPHNPAAVGVYQTGADGLDNCGIEVRDGLAYLPAGSGGLEVLDVSEPPDRTRIGGFPFSPYVSANLTQHGASAGHGHWASRSQVRSHRIAKCKRWRLSVLR